jgi:deoxyhypusine synthase
MKVVRDLEAKRGIKVSELLEEFSAMGGFQAKNLAEALRIWKEMHAKRVTIFLSFPACIVATGLRGVLKELVKQKLVDVVITTCGTLDHDLARIWKNYYHGSFSLNDKELAAKDLHRIGNVLVPKENYGLILEEKLQPIIKDIYAEKKSLASFELVWEIGKRLESEKNKESSIVWWAWRNKIPIFVPGISDGAVGSQLWLFWESHRDFVIDTLKDEHELSEIIFSTKRTGAIVLGGGIAKHHLIWWNQFKGGLDYAIYITSAIEWDGSLSGAPPREAISWKKIKSKAKYVQIFGDVTLVFPLLFYAFLDNVSQKVGKKASKKSCKRVRD